MNQIKFFIVSVHRDYIVRFHAQAENLVSEYHNRYPTYLFHVKKIEAYLFCFSIIPPEEADETYLSTYAAELKKSAERLAKKKLREKNSDEFTGSFSVLGNIGLLAAVNVMLSGYGRFDGKYIITRATHSAGSGGYNTDIEVRRCLDGY